MSRQCRLTITNNQKVWQSSQNWRFYEPGWLKFCGHENPNTYCTINMANNIVEIKYEDIFKAYYSWSK